MRLLRCMFVNFAVTAIAEDLFGGDALLLDDPDSVNNSYDLIDVPAGVPDFSFTAADSASPESDMFASSCLPSDPDPQLLSRVRVRVRDDAKVCAPNTLPSVSVPNFQDLQQGVWNILDQPAVDDKKTTNPNPESIPGRGAPILVSPEDPANCRPEKPYRLCCIGAGNPIEIDLLSNPVYTLFRRCELVPNGFCQNHDVCCKSYHTEGHTVFFTGFMCYEISMITDHYRPDLDFYDGVDDDDDDDHRTP